MGRVARQQFCYATKRSEGAKGVSQEDRLQGACRAGHRRAGSAVKRATKRASGVDRKGKQRRRARTLAARKLLEEEQEEAARRIIEGRRRNREFGKAGEASGRLRDGEGAGNSAGTPAEGGLPFAGRLTKAQVLKVGCCRGREEWPTSW